MQLLSPNALSDSLKLTFSRLICLKSTIKWVFLSASLSGSFAQGQTADSLLEHQAQAVIDTPSDRETLIFYQGKSEQLDKFRQALEIQLKLKMPQSTFNFVDLTNLSKRDLEEHFANTASCAMAIGPYATQKMLSVRKNINHFSVLASRNLLDKLHRVYARLGIKVSGIYEEQPFYRQIFLSKALAPGLEEIGLLLNQKDKYYLSEYQSIAEQHGLTLNYRILNASDSPEKYLADVADQENYLLLTNNSQLFMKSKLAAMVLTAYYQQVKLIGNRYQDAEVGTLASIYTPSTTLAIEASNEFKLACEQSELAKPRYAESFSVIINKQIAENLNMGNINTNQLSKSVTQLENQWLETSNSETLEAQLQREKRTTMRQVESGR